MRPAADESHEEFYRYENPNFNRVTSRQLARDTIRSSLVILDSAPLLLVLLQNRLFSILLRELDSLNNLLESF
jgi:hypothetical protein